MNISKLKQFYKKHISFFRILFTTMVFGILGHGYAFFNPSLANDGLMLDLLLDEHWQLQLGRFFQPLIRMFSLKFYNPFIGGVLWLGFLGGGLYVIKKLFDIKNDLLICCLAALIVTNSFFLECFTACENVTYVFSFAFFLTTLSVYFFNKNKLWGYIVSAIFIIIMLATYQAYICTTIVLFIVYAIKKLIYNTPIKDVALFLLKAIVVIVISVLIYILLFKTILLIARVNVADQSKYNSPQNFKIPTIKKFIKDIFICYKIFFTATIFYGELFSFSDSYEFFLIGLFIITVVIAIFMTVRMVVLKKLKKSNMLLVFALTIVFPIFSGLILFVSEIICDRMYFASFIIFIIPIIIYEKYMTIGDSVLEIKTIGKKKIIIYTGLLVAIQAVLFLVNIKKTNIIFKTFFFQSFLFYIVPLLYFFKYKKVMTEKILINLLTAILIIMSLFSNIFFSNKIHMKDSLTYQRTLTKMSDISCIIDSTDGTQDLKQIVFIGGLENCSLTYEGTYIYFLNYVLAKNYEYPKYDKEDLKNLLTSDQKGLVNNLSAYPKRDCVICLNDVIIVKLQDYTIE